LAARISFELCDLVYVVPLQQIIAEYVGPDLAHRDLDHAAALAAGADVKDIVNRESL
jgi:hypothetical protein